jgi:hypothetical protein
MEAVGTLITSGFRMLKILFLGSMAKSLCFLSEKVLSFDFEVAYSRAMELLLFP